MLDWNCMGKCIGIEVIWDKWNCMMDLPIIEMVEIEFDLYDCI